jgi:hypothetical protein
LAVSITTTPACPIPFPEVFTLQNDEVNGEGGEDGDGDTLNNEVDDEDSDNEVDNEDGDSDNGNAGSNDDSTPSAKGRGDDLSSLSAKRDKLGVGESRGLGIDPVCRVESAICTEVQVVRPVCGS